MLSVTGVADAVHIATYYVGNILIDAGYPPTSSNSSYRPSSHYSSRGPRGYPSSHQPSLSHSSYGYSSGPYGHPPQPPYPPHHVPTADPSLPQQTQQIYIPNDLVGCIIGKGGSKINEIRSTSGSTIKIMEPGAQPPPGSAGPSGGPNERLVIITGQAANIQIAVQLLYHVCSLLGTRGGHQFIDFIFVKRLEQEKQKQLQTQSTQSS